MSDGLPAAADAVRPEEQRSSWLTKMEAHFREKHPVFVKLLAEVGGIPESSSFLQLLGGGMKHEKHLLKLQETHKDVNYIGHPNASLRLFRTQDTRKELAFPPYHKAGKVVGKFTHLEIAGLPEYDGMMDPKKYGEKCGEYASQIMEGRYQVVVELLSPYHQYYVRKSMGTEKSNIVSRQRIAAEIHRVRQPTVATRPQPVANAASSTAAPFPQPQSVTQTDGGAAPRYAIPSPIITSPALVVDMHPCQQEQVTPKRFVEFEEIGGLEPFTPHLNKRRKTDKASDVPGYQLPSARSNSTPNSPHSVPMHGDDVDGPSNELPPSPIAQILRQGVPSAPPQHPLNQQASSPNVDQEELLESLIEMLKNECPKDQEWVMTFARESGDTDQVGQIIRACQMFVRLEIEGKYECQRYRNIVDAISRWVLRTDKSSDLRNISSLLEADMQKCGSSCHESFKASLHRLVSKKADKEKLAMQCRCNVVLQLLSPEDRKGLETRVKRAKEDVQKDLLIIALEEIVRESRARGSHDNHDLQRLPSDGFQPQDLDGWIEFLDPYGGTALNELVIEGDVESNLRTVGD